MDLKRNALTTGLGDGPDAKRATAAGDVEVEVEEEQQDQESGLDNESSETQTETVETQTQASSKDIDCDSLQLERGNISPNHHVAPYTGNGCAPSIESFMFQQTPAGSRLCSWMARTESKTSSNEVSTLSEQDKDLKVLPQNSKLNRKELTTLRRQNALRALALERELSTKSADTPTLLIRFPDPKINVTTVSEFSQSIRDVIFPASVAQRYCMVHLKAGSNVEQAIEDIKRMRFGHGHLHAELKTFTDEEQAESIDPCSLYVSNIPFNMNAADIKAFVNSMRVDIGVMKRQKRARYAFVRYSTAELAIEAFRDLVRRTVNNRVLTVRYRRLRKRQPLPAPAALCGISNLTIDTIVTDDDGVECRVISPPPIESITILDSDEEEHGGSMRLDSSMPHKKKKRDNKLADSGELQRLAQLVTKHEAFIKSLQKNQHSIVTVSTKVEPQSELTTDKSSMMHRSLSPCSSYDIKIENEYFGIAQSSPMPEPESEDQSNSPYRTTTCLIGIEDPIKSSNCFGWLISGFGRRMSTKSNALSIKEKAANKSSKDARMEGLLAQLDKDTDV